MKLRRSRSSGTDTAARHQGLDSMPGRLVAGLLVLALVPALLGVFAASALSSSDAPATVDRARQTSTVAAELLVRAQAIETRLAVLAADADTTRIWGHASNPSNGIVQRARATMSSLRGRDGSIVAGACMVRASDGRSTVIAEDREVLEPSDSCAQGAFLETVAGLPTGTIARLPLEGSGQLLIATPISGNDKVFVLSAAVDVGQLLEGVSPTAQSAATSVVIDRDTGDFVAGISREPEDEVATATIDPRALGFYGRGILTGHEQTVDALSRAGWTTTVADLWPTSNQAAGLGLIEAWPVADEHALAPLWLALAPVGIAALVGVLVLTRLLVRPFRELRESRSQLESMYHEAREDSLQDGLTGLGNHRAFQDELTRQLELSERDGVSFSLLLLDLDNLKVVNDREGHAEGDRLLTRLAAAMRETLRPDDQAFRIGGDEFAVLMPGTEPEAAAETAGRLRHHCLRPPTGERLTPWSGGISAIPRFALEASQVQRQADVALYWAKRHGRGFVEIFDPERDKLPDEEGPAGLGNAVYEIARGHLFDPVYQPIVDLRSGAVLGFEGLIRPDPNGPISDPERLFGAAAANGRTVELDLASFETVAGGIKGIGASNLISINLSAKTLEVRDFDSSWLLKTLVRHGISPSRVILELTEREPIVDVKRLLNNVQHLGDYGLRLAADDVGAGSAGLRMLAEIPFDIVKIDLSLVQSGAQQAASWAVLRSIRDLAWRQHSVIIGEGVETAEQLRVLQELEIPVGQGYLLGRPEPKADMRPRDLASLRSGQSAGATAPPWSPGDVQGLPRLPELAPDHPVPRPIPPQLAALPTSQLQPAT